MKSVVSGESNDPNRILIVDDAPEILSIAESILSSAGYQTIAYTDGLVALQIMELMPPDLIILDINMPRIDGYEMTKRIRSNSAWDDTPIVLCTALDPAQAAIALECGANDLLPKPFAMEELLGKVSLLLRSRDRQQLRMG